VAGSIVFLYGFLAPGVWGGLFDLIFSGSSPDQWSPEDIAPKVGRTLGRGNFGTVLEAFASESGVKKLGRKSAGDNRS